MKNKTKVIIVISCIFFLYCIFLFIKLLANPTDTFIVEKGKIYKEESQEGYIIRDEQIIENDEAGGKIVQLKAEGKKVANGEAIYRYTLENENEINNKIEELDMQIEEALKKENKLFSTDTKLLETQLEEKLEDVYENTEIQEIEQYKKEINNSLTKKAKIINNFKCYIACISKTDEAKKSEIGSRLKLRLPNTSEVPATIVHKSDQGNNGTLLVFEIEQEVESLINYRKINVDIIWWSDSGIKVPNSAIQYEGKFAFVVRNRAGYDEKIYVKVLRQNDNYSIVENYSTTELEESGFDITELDNKKSISLYDEIVIKKK